MNRLIEIGLLVFVFIVSLYLYGEKQYKNGVNEERAKCQLGINSLQSAIQSANSKSIKLTESQKDSYRIALDIRNKTVKQIESELKEKLKQIEVLKNESGNTCVNANIPNEFK